jgi:hypothetical protein
MMNISLDKETFVVSPSGSSVETVLLEEAQSAIRGESEIEVGALTGKLVGEERERAVRMVMTMKM